MNTKRMLLINVVLLVLLVGGGFFGYYYYNQSVNYISTDNAQVAGQQVKISAPANGVLTEWNGNIGDVFKKGDTIGVIQSIGENGRVDIPVTAPDNGTIVQSNAVENSFLAAGTPLAISYDLNNLWITANIEETSINEVKVGQEVDIKVDAYPNLEISGNVEQIGLATAGTFSLLPNNNTSGNYTKQTQVIPVKISLENHVEKLVPGMNATVRIHK
ncbi:efflux RND transporter periplasmic adaptor subunit [Bacillus sp. S/N-304-OC-R1]|uniref:efflux RND transporter periplasmic adaptor subunit n=1 Tax=Bacillus sp. S/N-304-OC-R1 TaxID=2758034 RepID=UPI001C8DCFBA|nr:efflux RND transporter periplasmic adaptor subunit [Bacillus sp. S/N-304-OC-R1]MBY0123552.1 HlyD family secretion protein [Bacillus sp. S/N-304-OC-R1]